MATWAVVGASRGLGYEFLRQLAADPANKVIATARTPSNVEEQLKTDGISGVRVYQSDLDSHKSLKATAQAISEDLKSIDYLIVNGAYLSAETGGVTPTAYNGQEELLSKELIQSVQTNAIGPLNAINAFLPLVRAGQAKKIVVISSGMADSEWAIVNSVKAAPSLPYGVSKAAVNLIVAKFAVELKDEGVAVLALSPGFVQTSQPDFAITFLNEAFKSYEPNFKGAITPEQSIRAMLKVINNFTLEQTGSFLSHLGNKRWLSANGVGDEVDA